MNNSNWSKINNTLGVTSLLSISNTLSSVNLSDIDSLKAAEDENNFIIISKIQKPIMGRLYQILEGPFKGKQAKFKKKIALGLDAKDGNLSVSGWKENLNTKTLDFLKEVNDFGVSRLIYTDINKDGTKASPNFNETIKIAGMSKCPVIISGGVSSINDIKKAKELNNKNIEGIIVGKAIYDGDIKLEELAKELDA